MGYEAETEREGGKEGGKERKKINRNLMEIRKISSFRKSTTEVN